MKRDFFALENKLITMNFKNVQLLIELIEQKATGSPAEIALKIGVTERMVYKYLDILKTEFNAPIKYNRANQSYFFTEDGSIDLRWQEEEKQTNKYNTKPKLKSGD